MKYKANETRYDSMPYRYCGKSGLKLPAVSLGLWHNFGENDDFSNMTKMLTTAFDLGITHFDLADNYGRPVAGSAEINFGKILKNELSAYRDEMIISTKAGHYMWPGPYGDFGSRKHLMSGLDASLRRMGLDYVDIFYHHRMDSDTPLEETMDTLADIVRSGKALYVGISKYDAETTKKACEILKSKGIHCLIHQFRYSMLDRHVETEGIIEITNKYGVGTIAFSPLEQGILSDRYLNGIPNDSRAAKPETFLTPDRITPELLAEISALNEIATQRGQSLSQMAISWLLGVGGVTSVLVGASKPEQITDNVNAVKNIEFSDEEIKKIQKILKNQEF